MCLWLVLPLACLEDTDRQIRFRQILLHVNRAQSLYLALGALVQSGVNF